MQCDQCRHPLANHVINGREYRCTVAGCKCGCPARRDNDVPTQNGTPRGKALFDAFYQEFAFCGPGSFTKPAAGWVGLPTQAKRAWARLEARATTDDF